MQTGLIFGGFRNGSTIRFFPGKWYYNGKHLQTTMSKRSKQVKITSFFGPEPSKSPKHSEMQALIS
jgi:hypothetical protein